MAVCLPRTITTRLGCQACGAYVDYRSHITETAREPGSVTFHVETHRDDAPWLILFDQAHTGPLQRIS